MKKKKTILLNIERGLIVAYAVFIGLFALDAKSWTGFLIHLFPSFIFLITLAAAWKKPMIAGILFILEGLGTIIVFNTYRDLFVLSVVSLIPILIGISFLIVKNPKH
jgi:hypothetical protein